MVASGLVTLISGSVLLGGFALIVLAAIILCGFYLAWEKGMFGASAGEPGAGNESGATSADVVHRTATMHSSSHDGGGGGF